jgi:hypothetical protein
MFVPDGILVVGSGINFNPVVFAKSVPVCDGFSKVEVNNVREGIQLLRDLLRQRFEPLDGQAFDGLVWCRAALLKPGE